MNNSSPYMIWTGSPDTESFFAPLADPFYHSYWGCAGASGIVRSCPAPRDPRKAFIQPTQTGPYVAGQNARLVELPETGLLSKGGLLLVSGPSMPRAKPATNNK